ncbi:MAG: DUF3160 domain-containing protein [Verrucomicrobiota bacterium]|jgi:hypothetical protein
MSFYIRPALGLRFIILFLLQVLFAAAFAYGQPYDLVAVKDIEVFGGSPAAKELLGKNGFVVAAPAFKQIFEAYIKSPLTKERSDAEFDEGTLPCFITTDSAWDGYHFLLEEGVKGLEEIQSPRLLDFSRRLLTAATDPKTGNSDLILFASVGLALQDEQYRQSLPPKTKGIVDGLRIGSTTVKTPIGFPLSPLQFRAQSFYVQSPELSDYFAARQWYASVVFRLTDVRETKSAVALAELVNANAELLALWKQLSDPIDALLAPAEDGTIREYGDAAREVLGTNRSAGAMTDSQIAAIQERLEAQLPLPRVNDQLLTPEQFAEFARLTRGFRLLPPRQLPCAVCFGATVDPKIPGRKYPSGLDFLAASPILRSPAAVRALQYEFGKSVSGQILKADCGPMPNSLYGEAMQLLAELQIPLPASAPAPMRTEAWLDLQLWTQLGAWAQERHTWALHTKSNVEYLGLISPPEGMVAPYPKFFSGLAMLTRRTAEALDKVVPDQRFDVKAVASQLLEDLALYEKSLQAEDFQGIYNLVQLDEFKGRYYEKHRAEFHNAGSEGGWEKAQKDLADLARRCAESGSANKSETETLQLFFGCRQNVGRMLNDFAPVCDRLAELAKKSLAGETLTQDDGKWIQTYGVTLAGLHLYYGNSYEVPRDDFPIVTRVYSSPLTSSMLYAGLVRPQALYVIARHGDSLQLYRGAVMAYREFVRPNNQLLDDQSWRQLIGSGQEPPATLFTRSFEAETNGSKLAK